MGLNTSANQSYQRSLLTLSYQRAVVYNSVEAANRLPEPVGSTLPRDRRGFTPGPATNNSLRTTHGILTKSRAPFFSAFVRLSKMGLLLLLKSIKYAYPASHQPPPFRDGHNRARGSAAPVTREREPYRLGVSAAPVTREREPYRLGVAPHRSRGSVDPTGSR